MQKKIKKLKLKLNKQTNKQTNRTNKQDNRVLSPSCHYHQQTNIWSHNGLTACPCKELVLVCISRQVKHSWTLSFRDSSWHGYTKTPHQTLTSIQVNANLKNQDLSTDLRWVAKRNRKSARKFTQVANGRTFHAYKMTCDQLVPTSLGGPTCLGIWARPKSRQVIAGHTNGWPNETQVER